MILECNGPYNNFHTIILFASILRGSVHPKTHPGFTPATPGCTRKINSIEIWTLREANQIHWKLRDNLPDNYSLLENRGNIPPIFYIFKRG